MDPFLRARLTYSTLLFGSHAQKPHSYLKPPAHSGWCRRTTFPKARQNPGRHRRALGQHSILPGPARGLGPRTCRCEQSTSRRHRAAAVLPCRGLVRGTCTEVPLLFCTPVSPEPRPSTQPSQRKGLRAPQEYCTAPRALHLRLLDGGLGLPPINLHHSLARSLHLLSDSIAFHSQHFHSSPCDPTFDPALELLILFGPSRSSIYLSCKVWSGPSFLS
ncbi:hypothetical protein F5884DRAFT_43830 [Xylogone sp. PMI_703]|nr:hypothetical protein F5884DRAFT_43830 [Xylogone sp. PMI_703]